MKYIFFDLDSTLYDLDEKNFLPAYFDAIGKKAVSIGFDYKLATHALYEGMINMSNSDGKKTNEQLFWEAFEKRMGPLSKEKRLAFDSYYDDEFDRLSYLAKPIKGVDEAIKALKADGYTLIVATNPVLPLIAQLKRMKWGNLNPADFALITSYDICHYSKPDPRLYFELAQKFSAKPEDCLMVGNDIKNDIISAQKAGFKAFLITEHINNDDNNDIKDIPQGNFIDLLKYINSIK